jgi:hypothetical protein
MGMVIATVRNVLVFGCLVGVLVEDEAGYEGHSGYEAETKHNARGDYLFRLHRSCRAFIAL